MEFIFLGTSAGVPTKSRNVTGLAVLSGKGKNWYLVDCGEATQHQLLKTPLSLLNLQAIFITHVHGDHCYGLPGLLASASLAKRTQPLTIIAPTALFEMLQTIIRITETYLSYELHYIDVQSITHTAWRHGDLIVQAHALSHRVPSYAYQFIRQFNHQKLNIEALKNLGLPPGPLWKSLQNGDDIIFMNPNTQKLQQLRHNDYVETQQISYNILVGGDNDQPHCLAKARQHVQVLIHEATYTQAVFDKVGPLPQHSSAKMVAEFAQAQQIPNLILTHFSSRYQMQTGGLHSIDEIASEANAHYKGRLFLAQDLFHYHLTKDGLLELIKRYPVPSNLN